MMNSGTKKVNAALASVALLAVLSSCAFQTGQFVSNDKTHPASPDAEEGAIEDPGRFLSGGEVLADAPAEKGTEASDARYVCPMHPDVRSDAPGRCPRCGMALKEKKADAKQEEHHHEH